jgi:hypothetical protein
MFSTVNVCKSFKQVTNSQKRGHLYKLNTRTEIFGSKENTRPGKRRRMVAPRYVTNEIQSVFCIIDSFNDAVCSNDIQLW